MNESDFSESYDLFPSQSNIKSTTHNVLSCQRCKRNKQVKEPPIEANCTSSLVDWNHCWQKKSTSDECLKNGWNDDITFVMEQKSRPT